MVFQVLFFFFFSLFNVFVSLKFLHLGYKNFGLGLSIFLSLSLSLLLLVMYVEQVHPYSLCVQVTFKPLLQCMGPEKEHQPCLTFQFKEIQKKTCLALKMEVKLVVGYYWFLAVHVNRVLSYLSLLYFPTFFIIQLLNLCSFLFFILFSIFLTL